MRRMILTFVFILILTFGFGFSSYGGELEDLKDAVKQLQKRIEQLEQRQKEEAARQAAKPAAPPETAAATPSDAKLVKAGSVPGSIQLPGTETSVKVYGNVRVDATYDFGTRNNDVNNNDWSSAVFAQPLDSNSANRERKGQFYATARASRLGLLTFTPTKLGELKLNVEADFNAPNDYMGELGSNGTMFRLRHAYGQLGNVLIGQTWSNFIDLRSYPETVDFNPTGDVPLIRQTQLRYTIPLGGSTLAFSAENPESLSQLPPYQYLDNNRRNDFNHVPDLVANWTWNGKDAHVSARAAVMEYRNDFRSKWGYALALSGSSKLGPGTLVGGVEGGEGVGRYMFNAITQGATDTGTELTLWKVIGWHAGYTYPWNASLRSNLIYSQSLFSENAAANAFLRGQWLTRADEFVPNKQVDQAFVNLFWTVTKNIEAGVEYAWGKRETFGDEKGIQHRVNTVVIYNFP